MPVGDSAHVKGLAELQKFLDQLPIKMEKNIMRGAMRAGMKVVQPRAQSRIRSQSGKLAAGLKIKTRALGKMVMSRLVATGPHAFIAKFIEFGTAAHIIKGRNGGWLQLFGGIIRKSVDHPGARANPFFRPALDESKGAALLAIGEYVKKRLTKQGIDTADIILEGDE